MPNNNNNNKIPHSGFRLVAAPTSASFHSSAPRLQEEKEETPAPEAKGISPLYAIPVGVALAVPIIEFNWYNFNEETLLASTFLGFCVVAYTQGGEVIANSFKEESKAMLKAQNEAEIEVIAKLEETVEYMKLTENIVSDYKGVLDLTEESYAKLNAAGKIKPQHDLKAQMEKMLGMVVTEEQSSYEKAKVAMMTDATTAVTTEFLTSKELKKAALDNAIDKLLGTPGAAAGDPVQGAFVKHFAAKATAAKAADDGSEEKVARANMLAKMNAIAENDGMYFRFDASGKPMLAA
jgi:hypothetical protein